MKLLNIFALLIVLGLIQTVQAAYEINTNGEIREIVSPAWRLATEAEIKAHQNPGTVIPIGRPTVTFKRTGFIRSDYTNNYNQVVVETNGVVKIINGDYTTILKNELNPFVIVTLISVIFMGIGNLMTYSNRIKNLVSGFSFLSMVPSLFNAFAAYFLTKTIGYLATMVCVFVAVLAVTVWIQSFDNNGTFGRVYWNYSFAFYILSIIFLFIH